MYVLIVLLIVFGFVSERSQVCGDFINPLNYVRYERAVIQVGKRSTIGSMLHVRGKILNGYAHNK